MDQRIMALKQGTTIQSQNGPESNGINAGWFHTPQSSGTEALPPEAV